MDLQGYSLSVHSLPTPQAGGPKHGHPRGCQIPTSLRSKFTQGFSVPCSSITTSTWRAIPRPAQVWSAIAPMPAIPPGRRSGCLPSGTLLGTASTSWCDFFPHQFQLVIASTAKKKQPLQCIHGCELKFSSYLVGSRPPLKHSCAGGWAAALDLRVLPRNNLILPSAILKRQISSSQL